MTAGGMWAYSPRMDTKHTLQLIDGDFSGPEAAHVLLSLVKSKIDFHTLLRVSNEERFGRDVSNSERRLAELRQLQEAIRSICSAASEAGQRLQVNGWIEITLGPPGSGSSDTEAS